MAAALAPFGWTCEPVFWQRYYTDPWVFNLANAVERLTAQVADLHRLIPDTPGRQSSDHYARLALYCTIPAATP